MTSTPPDKRALALARQWFEVKARARELQQTLVEIYDGMLGSAAVAGSVLGEEDWAEGLRDFRRTHEEDLRGFRSGFSVAEDGIEKLIREFELLEYQSRYSSRTGSDPMGGGAGMTNQLRSRVIRLAHAKPALRAHLLPLLKTAATVILWGDIPDGMDPEDVAERQDRLDIKASRGILTPADEKAIARLGGRVQKEGD